MTAQPSASGVVGLLDVEDARAARSGESRLPSPRTLYNQWERQPWAIAQVDVARDWPQ